MNQLAYDQREYDKLHNFEKKDIHDWAQEDSIIQAYQGKYWSHDLKMNDSGLFFDWSGDIINW